jgi:hypothetical protein
MGKLCSGGIDDMRKIRILGAAAGALLVAGCGTSAFQAPVWSPSDNSASRTDVGTFLRSHVSTYDRMISDLERGKSILEVPIIPAAVIGATGVALGASTDLPIVLGGGAAGLSAGSAYLRPRDRLVLVVQARAAAVCVHSKYNDQVRTAIAGGYLAEQGYAGPAQISPIVGETTDERRAREAENRRRAYRSTLVGSAATALHITPALDNLGPVKVQVSDVGEIAVEAAEEVVTRLKLRLANIGTAPDYGAIVTDLRTRFDDARASAVQGAVVKAKVATLTTLDVEQIKKLSEYSARIAECLTKLP